MTVSQSLLARLHYLPGLQQVESRLKELSSSGDAWTGTFSYVVTNGGKRLRPALVLLCGSFASASRSVLVDVACAAELIHTASLVHDDIIDKAAYRRNQPTLSARFGQRQAVLYGDFLFARAFSLLTGHGLSSVLGIMTRAISLMCEGEISQANALYDCRQTEADYYDYIYKKTAFFISACCLSGALAGGLKQPFTDLLAAYGLLLGYAFQITDDLLDFTGKTETTGKPVLKDLREGYLTLPVLRLLRHPQHSQAVRTIIEEKAFSDENLLYICRVLDESGIIREIQAKARTLVARAKTNLEKLPAKPAKVLLARLADYVERRTY
ncbi:MAG: polyprenyl synthetase family protein [Firmicutes bacterium]|nr:polyprenyl synthetase family protein [Bacillota bacterium]